MNPTIEEKRRENNASIERLQHAYAECTGIWRCVGLPSDRRVKCDCCDAEHPATPDNRLTAIDENYAGIYLKRLADEGARKLALELERQKEQDGNA